MPRHWLGEATAWLENIVLRLLFAIILLNHLASIYRLLLYFTFAKIMKRNYA